MLDWLSQHQPDILCLQETKARREQVPEEGQCPDGYVDIWHSAKRPGYSGVACFTKTEPLDVIMGLGEDRFDDEGRCLQLVFDNFVLINNYVPNGGRDLARIPYKLDYYKALLERSQDIQSSGKDVIMTGDWNTCHQDIDLARPKTNRKNTGFRPEERAWIDTFIDAGHTDAFRQHHPDLEGAYSWWSNRAGSRERNVGWRLDYFLINSSAAKRSISSSIQADVLGSDHCPVDLVWSV
jgi:exodeoxyribonuclease-3